MEAAANGQTETVKLLLEKRANIEAKANDNHGVTALMTCPPEIGLYQGVSRW